MSQKGWTSAALGEIAPANSNGLPARHVYVWNLSLDDIEPETGRVLAKARCKVEELGSAKCSFDTRHVLYSKLRPYLNKVVLPDEEGVGTSELIPLLPDPDRLEPEYLAYYLRSGTFLDYAKAHTRGANLPRIAMQALWSHQIPYPVMLEEQRRIVTRIKQCMQRIDELEACLAEASPLYAELKHAVVCEVLDDLRDNHPSATIEDLVKHDKTAMRSGPFGSAMKHAEFVADGNLVIGIANVQENRFNPLRKWMINDDKYILMRRYQVAPGDLLITIMGTVGRACIVPEGIGQAITSKHVYRIRLPRDRVVPEFVSFAVNYDHGTRRQLFATAIGGVMPGLNSTKLKQLRLVMPPKAVQASVVARLSEAHAALEERTQLQPSAEISALRRGILRKAFAGEL